MQNVAELHFGIDPWLRLLRRRRKVLVRTERAVSSSHAGCQLGSDCKTAQMFVGHVYPLAIAGYFLAASLQSSVCQ